MSTKNVELEKTFIIELVNHLSMTQKLLSELHFEILDLAGSDTNDPRAKEIQKCILYLANDISDIHIET